MPRNCWTRCNKTFPCSFPAREKTREIESRETSKRLEKQAILALLRKMIYKRELLNWWAMSLWTHDKIPKAIGAEHIQFHDLRYAFAALSLKNRGGRKTVIWGCRATIRMDPPFAPTPIPHPERSRALGAPSASIYGKNRRSSICWSCGLSVFRFAGLTFFKTVFSARLPPAPRRTAGTAPALPDQFAHRTPQWGSQADTPR